MDLTLRERIQHGWNAFLNRDPTISERGMNTSYRPDRVRLAYGTERSIISSIYNRLSIDVAAITMQHVRLDQNGRYVETMVSGLNDCLNVSANIDQTGRSFIQDLVMSMFDEGCIAVVPVDTTLNPNLTGSYDIQTMRVGKILDWYPSSVRIQLYNEKTGLKQEVTLPKSMVAIIENPLYAVMNEPNSTLKRLITKLNLLDAIDQQTGANKLDLILQLPYVIKTPARQAQAEQRRKDLETQLASSKFGIAYTDGTEKVTQLNRPVENNLMAQIEYLTNMLYSQLGLTQSIFEGTADEKTMLNYFNRTIEPCLAAISLEFTRKFLTKTARTQKQSVTYFRDPFRLVPVTELADIADKFTRNEILSSNDVRAIVGYKPKDDERAEALVNKNIAPGQNGMAPTDPAAGGGMDPEQDSIINSLFAGLEADIDKALGGDEETDE